MDDDIYTTTDFTVASYLEYRGILPVGIEEDKRNKTKKRFIYENTPEMQEVKSDLLEGNALVEPFAWEDRKRNIKKRIYNS